MAELFTKIAVGMATVVGMKMAGKAVPAVGYISMGASMVKVVDDEMRNAVCEDVMKLNAGAGGISPSIVLVKEFKGSGGKQFLEQVVKAHGGGTAWFQQSRNRMECFHHYSKKFLPKKPPSSDYEAGIGHIVHGEVDSI